MKDGQGAPYYKLFFDGREIQDRVESFKYKESEDDDECCEINVRHDDRFAADKPEYQEGAVWTAVFGFINGATSPMRKLYLQEIKWEYDDENLLVTLSFTERGVSLKQRSTSKVYTKTSIIEILHDHCRVHGLTPLVEIPGQYIKPQQKPYTESGLANSQNIDVTALANKVKKQPMQIEITDSIVKVLKDYAAQQVDKEELDKTLFGTPQTDIRQSPSSSSSGANIPIPSNSGNRDNIRNLLTSFNTYGTIPQANRTDKQLLVELAKRQPDGPYFIDTQDDKAVLKRRHFDKPSHRTFNWANGDGELLAFQPESKNRAKKGTSVGMSVMVWDKKLKKWVSASTNADNESNKNSLVVAQQKLDFLNKKLNDPTNSVNERVTIKQFNLAHDNTNVVKILPARVAVLDQQAIVDDQVNKLQHPETNNKNILDPTARNPKEALDNAGNARRDGELKNNPGYIEIIGDPSIHKGQIVTILGVSKKHGGNYYIKNVTHEIDGYKSYITRCDLVRQGINIKTNSYRATDKTINKTVGPDEGSNVHIIPTEQFNLKHDATNTVTIRRDIIKNPTP